MKVFKIGKRKTNIVSSQSLNRSASGSVSGTINFNNSEYRIQLEPAELEKALYAVPMETIRKALPDVPLEKLLKTYELHVTAIVATVAASEQHFTVPTKRSVGETTDVR